MLALAPLFAHAENIKWRGQWITVKGAEVKRINPGAANEELVLIYKNTSGENTLTLPAVDINARLLAVGGGGGGGTIKGSTYTSYAGGGGGGAGEFVEREGLTFNGDSFTFTVGEGGTGGEGDGSAAVAAKAQGGNGSASIILRGGNPYLTAVGGGGGGGQAAGSDGGSGGGSSAGSSAIADGGASLAADGLGNAGGGSIKRYGGGGGGANAAGAPGVDGIAGAGGDGKMSNITGIEETYAGGGGGGCTYSGKTVGAAGAGGGGLGAGATKTTIPTAGVDGLGGGGGGGSRYWPGQKGGSGVIIIRLTGIVKPLEWVALTGLPQGWSKIEVATEPRVEWKNGELLLTYTNVVDACGFRVPEGLVQARTLVIGGGGAGGTGYNREDGFAGPGGGGAGGFVEANDLVMSGEYKITVGAGGAAAKDKDSDIAKGKPGEDGKYSQIARSETDSYFYNGGKADGGGGGGAWHDNGDGTYSSGDGRDGASGGGGSAYKSGVRVLDGVGGKGTAGQGHDGALGNQFNVGGGGGGAGQAAPEIGGDYAPGGDGLPSDITGEETYYAGGGGGSRKNLSSGDYHGGKGGGGQGGSYDKIEDLNGKDGFGGGGGGGNQVLVGGKGGDGVVIIRIKACVPFVVPVPTGRTFTYDGTEKQGVDDSVAYKQSGEAKRTNADNYHTILMIDPSLPDMVVWGDATGGRGERSIPWAIHPLKVDVPVVVETKFVFDDNEHVAVAGVDAAGYCSTNVVEGVPLKFCQLTDYKLVNACRTNFVATLCNYYDVTPNVTNFVWRGKSFSAGETPPPLGVPALAPATVPWSIAQATNEVTLLTLGSWQWGTTAATPNSRWKWDTVTKKYPHPDEVTYQYRVEGTTAWSEAKTAAAFQEVLQELPANGYELRCYICKDSNHPAPHEGGNWCDAEKVIRFYVWRHPAETFTDFVDIVVSGNTSASALSDFPVLVRLREPVDGGRGGGLPGFSYARAGRDGSEIRFVLLANSADYALDDDTRDHTTDTLLPYEIDIWDPKGESLVWVKVPSVSGKTTKFRLYWRRKVDGKVTPDILPQEVWANGYVGVWHLNGADAEGRLANSTSLGAALDATGRVEIVEGAHGLKEAHVLTGNLMAPDYQPFMPSATSPFTVTGWYRDPDYTSGNVMFAGKKLGGQTSNPFQYASGWCWIVPNNANQVCSYANGNNAVSGNKAVANFKTTSHFLGLKMPAMGTSQTSAGIIDATTHTQNSRTVSANALPFQLAGQGFAASEVRLSKIARSDDWLKAEYNSVADASFCTFGLVNQRQLDDTRVWVNWWEREPNIKRYWDLNTLDRTKWYAGTLAGADLGQLHDGTVTNKFQLMPSEEEVDFPNPAEKGAYLVEFYQMDAAGTPAYPGAHILYDGTRTHDFEIVGHNPQPIDPSGPEGATVSGRVLTANDDTDATHGVEGQGYWRSGDAGDNPYWTHENAWLPELGVNLRPGSVHVLRHIVPKSGELVPGGDTLATNDLWTLYNVYVGNLMTNDNAVADDAALSNRWNTLPWSPTSKAISAKDAPFKRSEVGQLFLRNEVDADITSQVFTNGIGTVYFDAVNVYAGADVSTNWYKLVVEVGVTNDVGDTVWAPVPLLPLDVASGSVKTNAVAAGKVEADWPLELQCLNVQNGGKISAADAKFCRVCAKVDRREPVRFRIRRTDVKTDAGGLPTDKDDVDGFIAIDNVVASWPAPLPSLVPTGSYDASRHAAGAPVLGVEGAFSVAYPTVGDSVFANVRMTGGEVENIASARFHYRWRYVDTDFDPQRVNGRDNWYVMYFNVTNTSFSTVSPLKYRQLPGDIEYYYDLTAFVPYYEYCDYSGCGLEAQVAKLYGEEPDKYSAVHSDYTLKTGRRYPSNGTDWFVRLREFPNARRGWTLYVKRSEAEDAPVETLPLELLSTNEWRACCVTTQAVKKLYFRLESERPEGSQVERIHTVTNCWRAESATELPKRLTLTATESKSAWETVPCDAKSGCLMFLVDETKGAVTVAHADRQDFNRWSSAVNTNELFVGSSTDTNATSVVAKEYDATVAEWPLGVATNANWNEDFKVGGGQVASVVYPRNVPFKNSRTGKGWTAVNAMWTHGKWALQNVQDASKSFGDDSAVQLTGCGYGSLSFADAANSPDGLDTVRYTARVAQYNDGNSVTYYKWYRLLFDEHGVFSGVQMAQDFANYTFATCAALTETGASSFDGDGSMSLIAYYDRGKGFYEFRVSRGWNSTAIRLALFRWRVSGSGMVCEPLLNSSKKDFFEYDNTATVNIGRVVRGGKTPLGGLFISAMENAGATLVTAGVCEGDVSTVAGTESMSGQKFTCLTYNDKSASRLLAGAFGVMSCNCPAVFVKPACFLNGISSYKPTGNDVLQSSSGKVISFNMTPKIEPADIRAESSWSLNPGRIEMLTDHVDCWGLQAAPVAEQKVYVQVSEAGKDEWTDVATNVVRCYTDDTFVNPIRDARKLAVRLQLDGGPNDVRTDVAVNGVELTQWNGQWTPGWDTSEIYHYLKDEFAYTSSWVEDDVWGVRGVRLQPSRARNLTTPVSIRTPLMRGLGLLHFKWRNADRRAKLKVQVNEIATEWNVRQLTEAITSGGQASGSWETIDTIDFSDLPANGEKSIYVNRRYDGWEDGQDYYRGMIRLVVDEEVVAAAKAVAKTDPLYGALEIVEAYAWDLPEYEKRSWSGWNFRAAGWTQAGEAADGSADRWANLADGYHGLSGLLNNTLDESTLADREKGHYNQKPPHVQSPAFQTNCVAAVSFRARLYEPEDLESRGYPAVVTVYGTRVLDEKGEPKEGTWEEAGDVYVSNRVYTTHTIKLKASNEFKAIRLGIKGVAGVTATGTPPYDPPLRVALDDVCIWERQAMAVSFRKNYVRPFRDAAAIKLRTAVPDIASSAEQPLAGEAFGFQAEVEVQDPDEVVTDDPAHPITVELWFYPGAEPWGFENWKTNAGAVRVAMLPAAEGENLIFRSMVDVPTSLCPPQLLTNGQTHAIVQYQMIAHYYDRSFDEGLQPLTRDAWAMPSWNVGFKDPNDTANQFSAFTLLERLAPGRAWINEVNFCEPTVKAANASQWFELAVPSGEDMTGWKVTAYDYEGNVVGQLAELGYRGMPASKTYTGSDPTALASHYAFYVVKGPHTVLDKGQYDGVWPLFKNIGELDYNRPYAFELTRPTGIVEHRAVVQGWNQAIGVYWYWGRYEGTNLVEVMNAKQGVDSWVWGEEDLHGEADAGMTVGVVTNQGMQHVEWKSPLKATPGEINQGQYIAPDWFTRPNGGYVWIYSNVIGDHLWQVIGNETNKVGSLTVAQGSNTNITFLADRWYGLGECQVTPSERTSLSGPSAADKDGRRAWTLSLNLISNRIDVVAREGVADEVAALIDPKYGAYRPAIMKWLEKGVTGGEDGGAHPFKNPNGPIVPAYYRGNSFDKPLEDEDKYKLDLVGMYWLDIDPTEGAWELWGGMGDRPGSPGTLGQVDEPVYRTRELYDGSIFTHTNHLTTVWLELCNTNSGVSYPPYRLQGLGNEQSDDPSFSGAWTSANFKVTMRLVNGKVDDIFRPMRHFVFDKNSFRAKDDPVSPYAARIEITDPFSRQSPAWEWGWPKYSDCNVFTGWGLDGRVTPNGVSTLKKDDTFEF